MCVLGRVIRVPNMCLVLREDRLRRMPLASPLVSPSLVKRRFDRRPWPPNETAVWFQRALDVICGYDRRSGRRIETAELDLMHLLFSGLILRFNRRPGRRIETAEWDIFKSVSFWVLIGGFDWPPNLVAEWTPASRVQFGGWIGGFKTIEWNRRLVCFKGNLSFHLAFSCCL